MFDIQVTAEKQSPFSRAAQNELIKELYAAGFFAPDNALPTKVALDAMDFEGKDKLLQEIEQNDIIMQQLNAAMGMIQDLAMANPMVAEMAMSQGLIAPEQMMDMQAQQGRPTQGQAEELKSGPKGNSYAEKIRARSANAAAPQ